MQLTPEGGQGNKNMDAHLKEISEHYYLKIKKNKIKISGTYNPKNKEKLSWLILEQQ